MSVLSLIRSFKDGFASSSNESAYISKTFNQYDIPSNLEEALNILNSFFSDTSKSEAMDGKNLIKLNFSLNYKLRETWKLWDKESLLKEWFKSNYKIDNPEIISQIIILVWHNILINNNIKIEEIIKSVIENKKIIEESYKTKKSFSLDIGYENGLFKTKIIY